MMAKGDCPYLNSQAHDGAWEMLCRIDHKECNHNWEECNGCMKYNQYEDELFQMYGNGCEGYE